MTTKGDLFTSAKRLVFEKGCRGDFEKYLHVKSVAMHTAASVGLYERRNLRALRSLVLPGDLVVDGGANFGVYTGRLQGLVGPQGAVIAVEPLPFVFDRLVERYGTCPNVELIQMALSDHAADNVNISVPYLVPGLLEPALASLSGTALDSRDFPVSATTLDHLLSERGRVSFIKLDLEGHELPALAGARGVLLRDRPIVQYEVNDSATRWEAFREFADSIDYVTCIDSRFGLSVCGNAPTRGTKNFYLVPMESEGLAERSCGR